MQTYTMLERFDRQQEIAKGHLDILDETCRILHGLKLCSRYCATCHIACNIAELALPLQKKTEVID